MKIIVTIKEGEINGVEVGSVTDGYFRATEKEKVRANELLTLIWKSGEKPGQIPEPKDSK